MGSSGRLGLLPSLFGPLLFLAHSLLHPPELGLLSADLGCDGVTSLLLGLLDEGLTLARQFVGKRGRFG